MRERAGRPDRAFLAADASRAVRLTRRMIVTSTRRDGDQLGSPDGSCYCSHGHLMRSA
jgi:hypothetical protein